MTSRALEQCYEKAIELYGELPEPLTVIDAVDAHRMYWRPDKVHTVLLAESHVYTPADECKKMMPDPPIQQGGLPSYFTRFVYCLGYGENQYVGGSSDLKKNTGTWQYWKLLASAMDRPGDETFAPYLKSRTRDFTTRLDNKLKLLEKLKRDGVWLLDASVLALYRPDGTKPTQKTCKAVIASCWERYVHDQLVSANPHSILVIGNGVYNVLEYQLKDLERKGTMVKCVMQPQGARKLGQPDNLYRDVYRICDNARSARNATRIAQT